MSVVIVGAFGRVLRRVRRRADLTQERLAHDTGLDTTFISMLERGRRGPTLVTLWVLAERLGIRPSELVALIEEEITAGERDTP